MPSIETSSTSSSSSSSGAAASGSCDGAASFSSATAPRSRSDPPWALSSVSSVGVRGIITAPSATLQRQPRGRPSRPTQRSPDVALDLFARDGFEATTMDDVAAALGVSRRTLFRYFASKNDMVWGDFDGVLARLRELPRRRRRRTSRCMTALRRAVVASNHYGADELPELRIRMTLITSVPAPAGPLHAPLRGVAAVIAEFAPRAWRGEPTTSPRRRSPTPPSAPPWPPSCAGCATPTTISSRTSVMRTGCWRRASRRSREARRGLSSLEGASPADPARRGPSCTR